MEREIKFRAWHKMEEKMCVVDIISFKKHGAFLNGVRQGTDQIYGKTIVMAPTDGRFCDNAEFELLQYTGLKDKNAKEIYEGDIVKFDTGNIPSHFIKYHGDGFKMKRILTNQILPLMAYRKQIEITGNVFQNPELLK